MIIPRERFERLRWRRFFWANCGCCDAPQECTFEDDFSEEKEGYTIVDASSGVTWVVKIEGTGGTYTATIGGQTTAAIAWNSGASTVQAYLESLPNVDPGDLSVSTSALPTGFTYRIFISNSSGIPRADALGMTFDASSLTGGGITAISSEPNFSWGGGLLLKSLAPGGTVGDDASIYQTVTRPALNGLEISVAATVGWVRMPEPDDDEILTSTVGVFVGNAYSFFARPRLFDNFGRQPVDADGKSTGSGAVTFGGSPNEGDRLKLIVRDSSGGAGTYDVECLVNGTQIRLDEDVAFTLPDPINVGLVATDGGLWSNLCIETNA